MPKKKNEMPKKKNALGQVLQHIRVGVERGQATILRGGEGFLGQGDLHMVSHAVTPPGANGIGAGSGICPTSRDSTVVEPEMPCCGGRFPWVKSGNFLVKKSDLFFTWQASQ